MRIGATPFMLGSNITQTSRSYSVTVLYTPPFGGPGAETKLKKVGLIVASLHPR